MSDNSSEQEPSIEEILASIRQIISDEDEDAPQDGDSGVADTVEDPIRHDGDDVLDLSEDDLVEDVIEEAPVFEPEPEPEPEPEIIPEPEPVMEIEMRDQMDALDEIRSAKKEPAPSYEPEPSYHEEPPRTMPSDILSSSAQAAALGSLSKLTKKMPINSSRAYDGVTLEDIVKEMLHPMLREWMDSNLPPMVERIVQKELEKLARRAFDE